MPSNISVGAERCWRSSGLSVHRQIYPHQRKRFKALRMTAEQNHFSSHPSGCKSTKALHKVTDDPFHSHGESALPRSTACPELPESFSAHFEEKIVSIRNELDMTHQDLTFSSFNGTALSDFEPVSEDFIRKPVSQCPIKSCILDPLPEYFT